MKRIINKVALTALVASTASVTAIAQDQIEASVGADLVSSYIWRGQKLGNAAVQPSLSLGWKGLSLGAWGSVGIVDSDDTSEFDLTLSYTIGGFTVGITDYWFQDAGNTAKYFKYDAHETAHVWEANVGYDFGFLSANWYTNIGGADGVTKSGKRAYSSYVEIAAPFTLGGLEWEAAVGAVPYATSFYSDAGGFAVTNVAVKATKEIKITDSFSLPLFGQAVWNPSDERAYFVVGVSL